MAFTVLLCLPVCIEIARGAQVQLIMPEGDTRHLVRTSNIRSNMSLFQFQSQLIAVRTISERDSSEKETKVNFVFL
jgi:hypothetical protein